MSDVIVLEDIRKYYRTRGGTVRAVDGISLTIPKGSFTSIIGQSGSGKSTLMNILGCLDTPDSGVYVLDGIPVGSMKERELTCVRSQFIGFVFQSFHLLPSLNALENVELPLIYKGKNKRERSILAREALAMVGLEERIFHKPYELSGGQQQRVAIARAIAGNPSLILADEPTGNLDSSSGSEIMRILCELHRSGTTIVLITHDNSVAQMAQTCIRISDGKIKQI